MESGRASEQLALLLEHLASAESRKHIEYDVKNTCTAHQIHINVKFCPSSLTHANCGWICAAHQKTTIIVIINSSGSSNTDDHRTKFTQTYTCHENLRLSIRQKPIGRFCKQIFTWHNSLSSFHHQDFLVRSLCTASPRPMQRFRFKRWKISRETQFDYRKGKRF